MLQSTVDSEFLLDGFGESSLRVLGDDFDRCLNGCLPVCSQTYTIIKKISCS